MLFFAHISEHPVSTSRYCSFRVFCFTPVRKCFRRSAILREARISEAKLQETLETLDYHLQESASENVVKQVQNTLMANVSTLARAAGSAGDVLNSSVTNILRPVIINGIQQEASIEIEKFSEQLKQLIQHTFPEFHFNLDTKANGGMKDALKGAAAGGTALALGLVPLATIPVLGLIAVIGGWLLSRNKKKDMTDQIVNQVIPQVVAQARNSVREAMSNIKHEIAVNAQKEMDQQKAEYENTLRELRSQKMESQQAYETNKEQWATALTQLSEYAEITRP
ncbi:MAG: hypothetical protein HQM12_18715 [SAR324 cluster bacterium]|nr:hypothetical protein [SAR324 cluster bacterium]